jgi:hypothetical protein
MTMANSARILYLAAGLQSSGSTLISWCFLQRRDMNGHLDADNEELAEIPASVGTPFVWYKTTISCFRLIHMMAHYQDLGWEVQPLLLVRDVRRVWDSLVAKPYGRNGTTANDPPLRVRLRRFKEDWEHFRKVGWPIVRFEDFLTAPEATLRDACEMLGLPWDAGMINWPKRPERIAHTKHGSQTFHETRSKSLAATIQPQSNALRHTLAGDLKWLESEFLEFNHVNNYPINVPSSIASVRATQWLLPRYCVTREYERKQRKGPALWLGRKLRHMKRRLSGTFATFASKMILH